MRDPNKSVLNVYVAVPRDLESDWISLLRQLGFLSAECRDRGISLNTARACRTGFCREAPDREGPCVCIAMMDESDYTEGERTAAVELLKREGVACVIGLIRSTTDSAAQFEVEDAALHIIRYSEASRIRIAELPAMRRLLNGLTVGAPGGDGDQDAEDGGRARAIHAGLIAGCGPDLYALMQMDPDVIVALDSLPSNVWDEGFRGEILYYPIAPYGVLPFFILERLVVDVVSRLEDRKRVALFCTEDWGRIGYVAACVLFQRGIREPIDEIRQSWEASALSVDAQESDVRLFCYRHVARTYWHCMHLTRHIQIDSIDAFKADEDITRRFHEIDAALGDEARILLRFSGLLPSVRIMVEAPTMEQCQKAIDDFVAAVKRTGHYLGTIEGW